MYIRPTVTVTKFAAPRARYTLRTDLHNRRITIEFRRVIKVKGLHGVTQLSKPRVKVHTFPTRDEAREFVERVQERRDMLGYVQVSR